MGGGLGIRYTESDAPPSISDWVRVVSKGITHHCQQRSLPLPKLIAEPGRSLIGSACVTAYTIGGRKAIPGGRTYISVDGGDVRQSPARLPTRHRTGRWWRIGRWRRWPKR